MKHLDKVNTVLVILLNTHDFVPVRGSDNFFYIRRDIEPRFNTIGETSLPLHQNLYGVIAERAIENSL
jgi:hypothetical protein